MSKDDFSSAGTPSGDPVNPAEDGSTGFTDGYLGDEPIDWERAVFVGRDNTAIRSQYSGEFAKGLAVKLGLSDAADIGAFTTAIQKWAVLTWEDAQRRAARLTPKKVETELRRLSATLSKASKKIADGNEALSMPTRMELWDAADSIDVDGMFFNVVREIDNLRKLSDQVAASFASQKQGKASRRKPVSERQQATKELAIIWKHYTCKRPTLSTVHPPDDRRARPGGPFYDFVVAALEPIFRVAENAGDSVALDIRNVAADMKKQPGEYFLTYLQPRQKT